MLGVKETDVSQVLVKHGRVRCVKMTNPVARGPDFGPRLRDA